MSLITTGVQQMVDDVLEKFGRIDVLVNNAGHSSHNRRLLNTTPEEVRSVIDSNLIGTFFCTQAVVPADAESEIRDDYQYFVACGGHAWAV